MAKRKDKEREPGEVYGFVLLLRGIAWAAIQLGDHPAALRVLCVAAEYMNADGVCSVGQDTIAARLEISRQAVNRHLAKLEELEIIASYLPKDGVIKRYALDLEGLSRCRSNQDMVDERRVEKRQRKAKKEAKAAQQTTSPEAPPPRATPPSEPIEKSDAGLSVGDEVHHQTLGWGRIEAIENVSLT